MPRTKEEAQRLGIRVLPPQYNPHRRKAWNNYFMPGRYGITVHLYEYEDGTIEQCSLLGNIIGTCKAARYNADGTLNDRFPHIALSPVGRIVDYKIGQISSYENYKDIKVLDYIIMPTHVHLVIEITKQLPTITYSSGKRKQLTLGDMVRGFKQGTTSLYKRWLNNEIDPSVNGWEKAIETTPRTYTTVPGGKASLPTTAATSLWEDDYNDLVLYSHRALSEYIYYVDMNAYRWRMRDEYPDLFRHCLHITLEGIDYSAWGCMFLLRKPRRLPVMCHRLARKGMLTTEEWSIIASSFAAAPQGACSSTSPALTHGMKCRAQGIAPGKTPCDYEREARERKLGHFDRDWLYNTDPNCITPVAYTYTEAFRKQKTELLHEAEHEAVLVSPAISDGERDIIYEALERHLCVIKLRKNPLSAKAHPAGKDIDYCAQGNLVVLGPWEIPDNLHLMQRNQYGKMTDYSAFHNLNTLAEKLCDCISTMTISMNK